MAAKTPLDMTSEIDSPSTPDIVPKQEDQGEGGSEGRKRMKSLMSTPLRPVGAAPLSPQGDTCKKEKTEQEDYYVPRKNYACNVCDRSYVHPTSLKRHLNTHSWEKMYPCHYCDKVFAMAEYRTKHEIAHTGEKRYQCLLCNSTLINYNLLVTHCKQAHHTHPSGRKERRSVDDCDNVYRVLPCKTLKLQSRDGYCDINEEDDDGIVHIRPTPKRRHQADQDDGIVHRPTPKRRHREDQDDGIVHIMPTPKRRHRADQDDGMVHIMPTPKRRHRADQDDGIVHIRPIPKRRHRTDQDDGIVHIRPIPRRRHRADQGLQTPGASTHPRVHAQPGSHADPPSPCGAEFEFIIPETY